MVIENVDFHGFRRYVFGSIAALVIRPKLLYSNTVFVACPLTAKYLTFNDSKWHVYPFLVERANGRAILTVLRLSSVVCNVKYCG